MSQPSEAPEDSDRDTFTPESNNTRRGAQPRKPSTDKVLACVVGMLRKILRQQADSLAKQAKLEKSIAALTKAMAARNVSKAEQVRTRARCSHAPAAPSRSGVARHSRCSRGGHPVSLCRPAGQRHLRAAIRAASNNTGFPHVDAPNVDWVCRALEMLRDYLPAAAGAADDPNGTERRVLAADDGETVVRRTYNDHWSLLTGKGKACIEKEWLKAGGEDAMVEATAGRLPSSHALKTRAQKPAIAEWLAQVTVFESDRIAAYKAFGASTSGTLACVPRPCVLSALIGQPPPPPPV